MRSTHQAVSKSRVDSIVALAAGSLIIVLAAVAAIVEKQFALPAAFGVVGLVILGFGVFLHRHRGTVPDMPAQQWIELGIAAGPGVVTGMILLFAPEMEKWVAAAMVIVGAIFGMLCSRVVAAISGKRTAAAQ